MLCNEILHVHFIPEIPACLTLDSDLIIRNKNNPRRNEVCEEPKMILTSFSILNLDYVHEETFTINAGEHRSIHIEFKEFYVDCKEFYFKYIEDISFFL